MLRSPNALRPRQPRRVQQDGLTSILYTIEGVCENCDADSTLFDPEVLTEATFAEYFYNSSETIVESIDLFHEVELVECESDLSTFERVVIVEFAADCPNGLSFEDDQIEEIELAYVATYNRLAMDYQDPLSRSIEEARVITIGANNSDGNIPLELMIKGLCDGCDANGTDVYDVPSVLSLSRRSLEVHRSARFGRRRVQEVCYYPSHPVGERAPSESEFVEAYQEAIQALDLECIQSVGDCFFGTTFTTGVVAEFEGNETSITSDILSAIELAFQEAVDVEYESNEQTCNQNFVNVESVGAAVLTDDDSRRLSLIHSSSGELRGRRVQVVSQPSSVVTLPPSPAPTTSFVFAEPSSVEVLLYAAGVCNGCESDFTFSDQVIESRRRLSERRRLTSRLPETNCFCQLGAVVSNRRPSSSELSTSLNNTLRSKGVRLPLRRFEERPVIDCTAETRSFMTRTDYTVRFTDRVEDDEIETFGRIFKRAYNKLQTDYCDPVQTRITDIEVARSRRISLDDRNACVEYDVAFSVTGTCRGCRGRHELFSTNSSRPGRGVEPDGRMNVTDNVGSFVQTRDLQMMRPRIDESCLCRRDTIANRRPRLGEFRQALQDELETARIRNVCGNSNSPIRGNGGGGGGGNGNGPGGGGGGGNGPGGGGGSGGGTGGGGNGPGGGGGTGGGGGGTGGGGTGGGGNGPGGGGGSGGGTGGGGNGPGGGGGTGGSGNGPGGGGGGGGAGTGGGGNGPGGGGNGPGGDGGGGGGGTGGGGNGPGGGGGGGRPGGGGGGGS